MPFHTIFSVPPVLSQHEKAKRATDQIRSDQISSIYTHITSDLHSIA